MDNIRSFRPGTERVSNFHLAHVRSLIRLPFEDGDATNLVPHDVECIHEDRVAGQVTVILPDGRASSGVAFEVPTHVDVPSRRLAHGVLNGITYWFRCSGGQPRHEDVRFFRVYFSHAGKWLFFYTQGSVLPFGAEVKFSQSGQRSARGAALVS